MTQHFLVVNLGPVPSVQEFIASARRCQDLWFGSWLLSDLARATAQEIEITAGEHSLIFPGGVGNKKVSVANKIVALVPDNPGPAKIAERGRAAMMKRLEELASRAFANVADRRWDRALAMKQVLDLMEYVWVAVPLDHDYAAARRRAETLLSARKNTKSWGPVPWGPVWGAPKSSIDGLRESVFEESLYDDVRKGNLSEERLRKDYFVKKSERLCGVSLLKRVGEELGLDKEPGFEPAFHSTSHVTAGPLLVRIARAGDRGREAVDAYLEALKGLGVEIGRIRARTGERAFATVRDPIAKGGASAAELQVPRTFAQRGEGGFDGYLLFEDRLPEVLEMYTASTPHQREALARDARAALKQLFKALEHDVPPTAYYALLLADGDQMGKAIENLVNGALDEQIKIEAHRGLSRALEAFALGCREIVERNGGSLVYSGGDDVLAFLPLHTALACADELQRFFRASIREKCPTIDPVPTLSVGLGIGHHLDALGDVRALAKQAESAAKRERNSLGIAVSKRSGATLEITGLWNEPLPLQSRIDTWCRLFRAEELPDGVAFELEQAVVPFKLLDPAEEQAPGDAAGRRDVVLALIKRVIGRKRSERGEEPLDADAAALLTARFGAEEDPILAAENLSSELQIARLFLTAYESAWGEVSR